MSKQGSIEVLVGDQALEGDKVVLAPRFGQELNEGQVSYWLAKAINGMLPGAMGKAPDVKKLSTTMALFRGVPPSIRSWPQARGETWACLSKGTS